MAWVCEWSTVQGCFHVDTLDRILELNRDAALRGETTSFVPLAVSLSSEDAHAFAEHWRRLYRSCQPPPCGNYEG